MPPKGSPPSFHEIKLIEYWINRAFPSDISITNESIPENIKKMLQKHFNISYQQKSYAETKTIEPIDEKVLEELRKAGFLVSKLSRDNNFIQVEYRDTISSSLMDQLQKASAHITWLDFGKTELRDIHTNDFGKFSNLTRLRIEQNPITDKTLANLTSLKNLESLNVYGTNLSDQSVDHIAKIKSLKKLYIWHTGITRDAAKVLAEKLPLVTIDLGIKEMDVAVQGDSVISN